MWKTACPLLTLLVISGVSLPASAENLLEIYRLAVTSDPALRAAEAARSANLEIKPQSRALLFPEIDLSANTTENRQDINLPSDSPGFTRFKSSGYSINLVQPVFNYGIYAGVRQADARVAQANAEYDAAQQELMVRVADRYFNVLAAQDSLEFARAEKAAIQRQLEQSRSRFEVGLIPITDINEAQARFDLTTAQEIAADNLLANNREILREVTGQLHLSLAPLTRQTPLPAPQPADIEQWVDTALQQNLQVTAARFSTQVARQQIDVQRAANYPTLDIVGSYSVSETGGGRFGGSEIEGSTIGLELNAPLFRGGLNSSLTREAEFLHSQARELLEQQQRAVSRQTRVSYLGVLANISRVHALEQAVLSNQSAVDASQAGLEVGTRTSVDVLDAQRELFLAKSDYARARYDYILETLRLKQAAGTLSLTDLEQINSWLE
jgi:outer membrane protein